MKINPIDVNLVNIIHKLCEENNTYYGDNLQVKLDNYLINIHFGPMECLVFKDNIIIDGYVLSTQDNTYKGKSFFELLGGIDDTLANPISSELYMYLEDVEQPLPSSITLWNYVDSCKESNATL